ncbi:universal stress protein [Georgenia subflava]|uniref:Universal stress protein n=1 Tax=Georgenia subflava TaxID=1622177 RepID=A0A6N7EJW7_9MICO|nr:universal stress protein [Georgenia subflava]MPV37378.1 universal stress protein [Georgenia subflava]
MTSQLPAPGVVVGTDGSEHAELAVDVAAEEAVRRGVALQIVYVFPWMARAQRWEWSPPADALAAAESIADRSAARVGDAHPGLPVDGRMLVDDPVTALIEASTSADVVVVGARGRGSAVRPLLGSVSEKVAAHAHGPVIVVHERPPHPDGPVAVGMDPGEGAPEAVEFALEEARRRGVGLLVVQGRQHESFSGDADERLVEQFDTLLAKVHRASDERVESWRTRFPDVELEVRRTTGHPVEALAEAAAEAGVLVVGSRGRGGLASFFLGSVSRGVLQKAPLVAVVRVHHERARR